VGKARIGEMHANPRQQLVGNDRLGDVVDAAGFEPLTISWVSLSPVMKMTGTCASILLRLSERQVYPVLSLCAPARAAAGRPGAAELRGRPPSRPSAKTSGYALTPLSLNARHEGRHRPESPPVVEVSEGRFTLIAETTLRLSGAVPRGAGMP
jgi:hypothetical protein